MRLVTKIKENRLFTAIIIVELFFIAMLVSACFIEPRTLTMESGEWEAESDQVPVQDFADGTRGVLELEPTGKIDEQVLSSEEHELQPGAYQVTVYYKSETNVGEPSRSVEDSAGKLVLFSYQNHTALSTSTIKLDDGATCRTSRLWVRFGKNVEDFQGRILYNGMGKMSIHSVILEEYTGWRIMRILGFLFLFIVLDSIYLFFAKNTLWNMTMERKCQICGLGAVILFTSMLFLTDSLYYGHDLTFHLERIHAMADGFMEGQFPHRIQNNMLNGYGYVNPLFYGEFFLSIPAALYCLFVPLQTCYKIYAVLCNIATCLISYHCFKKMSKDWKIGLFTAFLYTASAYRMVDVFVRADVGEYTAMTFLPLVIYGFWKVYTKEDNEKITMRDYLPIVLGLSGIVESHVLTCYMLALFIPLFAVIMWKKTLRLHRFTGLAKSVGLLVLLNIWFVYPLLESLKMNIKITEAGTVGRIEQYGVTLSQLFGVFHTATGDSIWDGTMGEMPLTVGIGLSVGIVIFLYICMKREAWQLNESTDYQMAKAGFILAALAMFFATLYCPWDSLAVMNKRIDQILGTIQFSWRYLEIATIMLTVVMLFLMKILLEKRGRQTVNGIMIGIVTLALLSEGLFMMQYPDEITYKKYFAESELTGFDVGSGMEYILRNTDASELYTSKVTASKGVVKKDMVVQNGKRYIFCKNESGEEAYVTVPVLHYENYQAYDMNTKMKIPIITGENNCISLELPTGYEGTVEIAYVEPVSWRIAEAISVVTLIGIVLYMYMVTFFEKRNNILHKKQ